MPVSDFSPLLNDGRVGSGSAAGGIRVVGILVTDGGGGDQGLLGQVAGLFVEPDLAPFVLHTLEAR